MRLSTDHPDPLGVLASTKWVVENTTSVFIREAKLAEAAKAAAGKLQQGLDTLAAGFGDTGELHTNAQLIFLEDSINFCYWAELGQPKWQVEWPIGVVHTGGFYAMKSCFERALQEGIPLLDAQFLSRLTGGQAERIFRGSGTAKINLIDKRIENLREAGTVLSEKFGSQFFNLLEISGYDAIALVRLILEHFASFRDTVVLGDREMKFYKRAQICAHDMTYLFPGDPRRVKNADQLTAFADYKLPQVLREMGVLEYSPELARKIDAGEKIPAGSREEIEIRAGSVWAAELIRQLSDHYTSGQIDNALWLISQDIRDTAWPHHRTRTIFY